MHFFYVPNKHARLNQKFCNMLVGEARIYVIIVIQAVQVSMVVRNILVAVFTCFPLLHFACHLKAKRINE